MIEVKKVSKTYQKSGLISNKRQTILHDISFKMYRSECLGIIGESGSGKSTLGRLILGIEKPDSGEVLFMGKSVNNPRNRRGHISAVFQDYTSSINPNYTVYKAVSEPLQQLNTMESKKMRDKVTQLLKEVGLNESFLDKYPHEISGGEAQRVCIARAISTEPDFVVLDEAISSLDVSVQSQVLNLLIDLKAKHDMSYLFITHDIQVAAFICNRLIFFNAGRIVEECDVAELHGVKEEYSKKLLNAIIAL